MATKPPLITDRELLEQAATAIVQSGALVATARLGVEPNVAAAITLLLPLLGLGLGRAADRFIADRLPRFSKGYLRGLDRDQEKAGAKAKQQAEQESENPNHHDVMFRSFRMMMDAVDDSAVESIGVLAGQYNEIGRRPDAYFRALGRLLCDLEPGELEYLAALLAVVQEAVDTLQESVDSVDVSIAPNGMVEINLAGVDGVLGASNRFLNAPRMFLLLKRDGLATTRAGSPRYGSEGRDSITIDTEALRRILATISLGAST